MPVLYGCSSDDWFNLFLPKEADQFARTYLAALQGGNFEQSLAYLDPDLARPDSLAKLREASLPFADIQFLSIEVVGSNIQKTPQGQISLLTYQIESQNGWILTTIVVNERTGSMKVTGFHWYRIARPLGETNAFTFSGKSPAHFVIFGLAFIMVIFIGGTTIMCILSRIQSKWLWIMFIIVGLGQLNLNWTTGEINFNILYIQLFGAGYSKSGIYAPWIFSISIPIGAIAFLFKRKKLIELYNLLEAPRTIRKFEWPESDSTTPGA